MKILTVQFSPVSCYLSPRINNFPQHPFLKHRRQIKQIHKPNKQMSD